MIRRCGAIIGVTSVGQVFGRSGGLTRDQVVEGRCWLDPALDAALDDVTAPRDPAARVAASLAHLDSVAGDPERSALAHMELSEPLAPDLDVVRGLLRERGTTDREALALLAHVLVAAAWAVRGGGYAETVEKASMSSFQALLEESDEVALEALARTPGHAAAALARLFTARGLGVPPDEWWYRFGQARVSCPTLYPAHQAMLQALCKKWYGSHDLMFQFARQVAHDAAPGDPLIAVLPMAHAEYLLERMRGLDAGARWALVPKLRDERRQDLALVEAKAQGLIGSSHVAAPAASQLVGWFLASTGNTAAARPFLSWRWQRMARHPWGYVSDGTVDGYIKVLKEAKVKP